MNRIDASRPGEECGVFSITTPTGLSVHGLKAPVNITMDALKVLQNRGPQGTGITLLTEANHFETTRFTMPPKQAWNSEKAQALSQVHKEVDTVLGHTRYITSSDNTIESTQPFTVISQNPAHSFSFAWNGNVANAEILRQQLESEGHTFTSNVDTELIQAIIKKGLAQEQSMPEIFGILEDRIDGAFNIIIFTGDGRHFYYRNHLGNRPLYHGNDAYGRHYVASESSALEQVITDTRVAFNEVRPGILYMQHTIETGGYETRIKAEDLNYCPIELIYLLNPSTKVETVPTQEIREMMGRNLWRQETVEFSPEDTVVVAIPATANDATHGFSQESGIPNVAAIRKKSIERDSSFQEQTNEARLAKAYSKSHIDKIEAEKFAGKKVVLIDDSLIRSNTIRATLKKFDELPPELRPSEIHLRIASPAFVGANFYGIDIKSINELFTERHLNSKLLKYLQKEGQLPLYVQREMEEQLGVSSVSFLSIPGFVQATPYDMDQIDLSLFNGQYPTPAAQEKFDRQLVPFDWRLI